MDGVGGGFLCLAVVWTGVVGTAVAGGGCWRMGDGDCVGGVLADVAGA